MELDLARSDGAVRADLQQDDRAARKHLSGRQFCRPVDIVKCLRNDSIAAKD